MDHLRNKWALKSLTIGPQSNKTNTVFLEEALKGLPPLPGVDNVTVIHYRHPTEIYSTSNCWKYFDRILTRRDLFPALKKVYVKSDCGSRWLWNIRDDMRAVTARGFGPRKFLAFGRDHRPDTPYQT